MLSADEGSTHSKDNSVEPKPRNKVSKNELAGLTDKLINTNQGIQENRRSSRN